MSTSKLLDNKKRSHAAKVLQRMSKRVSGSSVNSTNAKSETNADRPDKALLEQYKVIREDIIKLKDDLTKGYGMAKGMVEKKGILKELLNRF